MMGRNSGIALAMLLFTVTMFGAITGAQVAYTADQPSEQRIAYNGTHYIAGENVSEINTTREPDRHNGVAERLVDGTVLDIRTPADPYIRAGAQAFAAGMIDLSLHVAALSGSLSLAVFQYLQFLPLWLVSGVFEVTAWVVNLAGAGLLILSTLGRL